VAKRLWGNILIDEDHMKKIKTAIILALVSVCGAGSAFAQFYPPYGGGYEREYYRPRYEEPRYDDRGYGYERRSRRDMGRYCVTSRGDCTAAPNYVGGPCRCKIPGFGLKRGNIQG
jgi:hypothetical protein